MDFPYPSSIRLNALVVDDNPNQLELVKSFLEDRGHFVVTALSPSEALNKAEFFLKKRKPFNIAFIDYIMPEMKGSELSRRLKDIIPHLFSVSVTAFTTPKNIKNICGEETFDHAFSKIGFLKKLEKFIYIVLSGIEENSKRISGSV